MTVLHQEMYCTQGDSNESTLTALGEEQAKRTATALSRMQFDRCAMPLKTVIIYRSTSFAGQCLTKQIDALSWGCVYLP